MKFRALLNCLEVFSFILWIIFTIGSIALAGLGLEGVIFAAFLVLASSGGPVHFPLVTMLEGGMGIFLSIFWRRIGVEHFHYLLYDSPSFIEGDDEGSPSHTLKELIREVEESAGYARNDARVKAKAWLIGNGASLDAEDIELAQAHFGYMLPAGWAPERKS